jgi:hypothetical protein
MVLATFFIDPHYGIHLRPSMGQVCIFPSIAGISVGCTVNFPRKKLYFWIKFFVQPHFGSNVLDNRNLSNDLIIE